MSETNEFIIKNKFCSWQQGGWLIGDVLCPRLAGPIPRLSPWVYYLYPTVSNIRTYSKEAPRMSVEECSGL